MNIEPALVKAAGLLIIITCISDLSVGRRLQHVDVISSSPDNYLLSQWLRQDSVHIFLVQSAAMIFFTYRHIVYLPLYLLASWLFFHFSFATYGPAKCVVSYKPSALEFL